MLGLDVAIILVLIGINGLLALSELAVVSSRSHRLGQRAATGNRGAAIALALAQEPTRFLSTIQIGITLVGIVAGAFGGARIGGHISPVLADLGLSEGISNSAGVAIAVIAITYLSLVFGEIVPKRIALHSPEAVAAIVAGPMLLLSRAGAPFVAVLTLSTSLVLRVLGLNTQREESVSEEEIRLLIGLSARTGSVEKKEAELLDRVFHFGDRRVHEVMTPRNLAVGIERGATIAEFQSVYLTALHSRFPVYDENLDRVVGVLGIKDVLAAISRRDVTEDSPIESLVRQSLFVPESKLIGELFREMQATGNQMAIALDEFGGTAGIVTLEQLLEEMVGAVRDELGVLESEITAIDAMTTEVDGLLSIEEAQELLGVEIPEGDYDTVAGYVLSVLGHIPSVGEAVMIGRHRLEVTEMRNVRIETLRVTPTLLLKRPH